MTNQEIAIASASKVCGVAKAKIVDRGRNWKQVEARWIVVLLLLEAGYTLMSISMTLKRTSPAIIKARRAALAEKENSVVFRNKYGKAKKMYDEQQSLRVSQDRLA